MVVVLSVLVVLSLLATVGVLLAGLIGVARGSPDGARSNKLMRWRIIMQGITIVLFLLLVAVAGR